MDTAADAAARWPKRWLPAGPPPGAARLRLFCFAHAGGAASVFRPWQTRLDPRVQVCAVQLPGRENRYSERPYQRMSELLDDLVPVLLPLLRDGAGRYAVFGHSMGADIAFALTRRLADEAVPQPARLFVAGHLPPHLPELLPPAHGFPDEGLLDRLNAYRPAGTQLTADDELTKLLLPTIRADFSLFETYSVPPDTRVACPITVLGGVADTVIPATSLPQWADLTSEKCTVRLFAGGHFFVESSLGEVTATIVSDLFAPPAAPPSTPPTALRVAGSPAGRGPA